MRAARQRRSKTELMSLYGLLSTSSGGIRKQDNETVLGCCSANQHRQASASPLATCVQLAFVLKEEPVSLNLTLDPPPAQTP